MEKYDPLKAEPKWRQIWADHKTFQVDLNKAKNPFYNLLMFPYPSGEGLHVGHVYAFGGADTYGRFQRLQGNDVFEPMGFDAFGIHSENFAIKKNLHPKKLIADTTRYFRSEQMEKLGALFDWDHSVTTSDPDYYRWTQWLFLTLYRAKLAIKKVSAVSFCPSCKTVLADEQVINGHCERCQTEVVQKQLSQWFFKITDYAERLLNNLEKIDWSKTTLEMQKNWIGKSEGAEIQFKVDSSKLKVADVIASEAKQSQPKGIAASSRSVAMNVTPRNDVIKVFTTRPDTLFGATFLVLAPEHPLVAELLSGKFKVEDGERSRTMENGKLKEVQEYVKRALNKSEVDRLATVKEKTGVDTGVVAINPLNNKPIPVWVADYVLGSYGTGAIMAVPAHDQRDMDFANKYHLDIIPVIAIRQPAEKQSRPKGIAASKASDASPRNDKVDEAYTGFGVLANSGDFNGLESEEAKKKISKYIEEKHLGSIKTNYHLRDWLISRQRYWGPPIPIIYCRKCWENRNVIARNEVTKQSQPKGIAAPADLARNDSEKLIEGWDYTKIEGKEYMIRPVPEGDLPVLLPEVADFKPLGTGKSPLASVEDFVKTTCPECGSAAIRETDVSDTFLDSSWYFLRYPSVEVESGKWKVESENELKLPWDKEITKKWLPVNMYIGGNEHAVLHLLYSRFITMVLHDLGYLDFEEPFTRFRAHGLIIHGGAKMSKSRGNVINPNEFIAKYGADTLRLYLLFIGPYEQGGDFSVRGIGGISRFLQRVWNLTQSVIAIPSEHSESREKQSQPKGIATSSRSVDMNVIPRKEQSSFFADAQKGIERNKTIKKITDDLGKLRFNTAIATLMEYVNYLSKNGATPEELKTLLVLLAPLAPFFSEEAWQRLNGQWTMDNGQLDPLIINSQLSILNSVHNQPWPKADELQMRAELATIIIQINGKIRDKIEAAADLPEEDLVSLALDATLVRKYIDRTKIKKTIFVKGKLVNFVT